MQKRRILRFILSGAIFLYFSHASAQTFTSQHSLNWQIITNSQNKKINDAYFLGFPGAAYFPAHPATPVYTDRLAVPVAGDMTATLQDEVYVPETDPVISAQLAYLPAYAEITCKAEEMDHKPVAGIQLVPLRKNAVTGQVEKLTSYTLVIKVDAAAGRQPSFSANKKSTSASLLASGTWYKFGVAQTGIYKLDYKFLKSVGIPDQADMNAIKIYGRPGGMLPQKNTDARDNDLVQNAMQVVSASGKLDAGSYILFYAKGPVTWAYDTAARHFHHQINYYSDVSYYFISGNADLGTPQKRITAQNTTGTPTHEISTFDALAYHELDTVTTITTSVKSGREWFGESFNAGFQTTLQHPINFDFPQADLATPAYMRTSTAARSFPGSSSFNFSLDNVSVMKASVPSLPSYDDFSYQYINTSDNDTKVFQLPANHFGLNVKFNPGASEALGWLNYIEFNVPSQLKYIRGQFSFRLGASVDAASNSVNRYHISQAPNSNFQVWDVTDFHNIVSKPLSSGTGEMTFTAPADRLREFVADDGNNYLSPVSSGKIDNQNLHSLAQPDMVIVTYSGFSQAADSVAQFHREHDNMVVHVVTTDQVYNEFSSGTQDITAIRDMMKMFWDRGNTSGSFPKFLLLMGAASYDYKDRVVNHTNFVPTYESYESTEQASSFASDDYYSLLADGEGTWGDYYSEVLQLSVGRYPVYNQQQAMDIFHKTKRYVSDKSMHNWRNNVVIVADDRQEDTFIEQAQTISDKIVSKQYPVLNVKKLYLDATPQVNTPAGQLFPQINAAINENVNNGCLVMNYIGHGGQLGWAHEKVLQIADIQSWNNPYNMPLIITATCNFSTFDDPDNISAGQLALFLPNGGPFSLLTTTREVEIGANATLDEDILSHNIFERSNGQAKFIGQTFIDAKNRHQLPNSKNFTLLGDPAIHLAMPRYDVKVTNIQNDAGNSNQFKALSLMTISGEIDSLGKIMDKFNGDIYPTVFDKVQVKYTLGQAKTDPDWDLVLPFNTQENLIYKGHATVKDGKFTFQFVVPKDISFTNGKGKLSFYATNGIVDANGYNDSIIVGGSDPNASPNHNPPVVRLFMNDTSFVAGGMVDQNPNVIARVHADLGINTLGSIGHNLVAELSKRDAGADNATSYILNNYYDADKDSYQWGTINYPFQNLEDGHYDLSVKVWDVADNSAQATTDFVVINSNKLTIDKIFNYPNPFIDETTFEFENNRPDEPLHVEIAIYDLNGKMVRDLQSDFISGGERKTAIHWNGKETGGAKVAQGLYVYQLTVKTQDGQIAQKSQKMVVIK